MLEIVEGERGKRTGTVDGKLAQIVFALSRAKSRDHAPERDTLVMMGCLACLQHARSYLIKIAPWSIARYPGQDAGQDAPRCAKMQDKAQGWASRLLVGRFRGPNQPPRRVAFQSEWSNGGCLSAAGGMGLFTMDPALDATCLPAYQLAFSKTIDPGHRFRVTRCNHFYCVLRRILGVIAFMAEGRRDASDRDMHDFSTRDKTNMADMLVRRTITFTDIGTMLSASDALFAYPANGKFLDWPNKVLFLHSSALVEPGIESINDVFGNTGPMWRSTEYH